MTTQTSTNTYLLRKRMTQLMRPYFLFEYVGTGKTPPKDNSEELVAKLTDEEVLKIWGEFIKDEPLDKDD